MIRPVQFHSVDEAHHRRDETPRGKSDLIGAILPKKIGALCSKNGAIWSLFTRVFKCGVIRTTVGTYSDCITETRFNYRTPKLQ